MVCGVVAYAVAVEEAVAHPAEPLALAARGALALSLALFVGGMAAAMWRATGRFLWPRIIVAAVTASVIVAATGAAPLLSLAIAFAGIVVVAAAERWTGSPSEKDVPEKV